MEPQACYHSTLGPEVGWQLQVCYNIRFQTTQTVTRPWLKTLRRKEELIVEFVSEVMEGLGWKNKWEKGFLDKEGTTTFWGLQLLSMYSTSWAVGGVLSVQLGIEAHTCRLKCKDHLSLWVQDQPGQDFILKQKPCFCTHCCDCCTDDWPNFLCCIAHYCGLWVEAEPLGLL